MRQSSGRTSHTLLISQVVREDGESVFILTYAHKGWTVSRANDGDQRRHASPITTHTNTCPQRGGWSPLTVWPHTQGWHRPAQSIQRAIFVTACVCVCVYLSVHMGVGINWPIVAMEVLWNWQMKAEAGVQRLWTWGLTYKPGLHSKHQNAGRRLTH